MTERLETILVGFGSIGESLSSDPCMRQHFDAITHAEVLQEHPAFNFAAVVDPSPEAQQKAKKVWNVPQAFADVKDAVKSVSPDVAILACPPDVRMQCFQDLQGVRGVILEKPIASNFDEAQAIMKLSQQRQQLVQVNYWRRADENLSTFFRKGLVNYIGDIQAGFALYGNGLHNNASHLIDFIQGVVGKIEWVMASSEAITKEPIKDDINLPFIITLANGSTISFSPLNFQFYREVSLDLWGTTGRLAFFNETMTILRYPISNNRSLIGAHEIASDRPEAIKRKKSSAFRILYNNLSDVLAGKANLISPLQVAMETERVIKAIKFSYEHNLSRVSPKSF